jgi:hypothetical protein
MFSLCRCRFWANKFKSWVQYLCSDRCCYWGAMKISKCSKNFEIKVLMWVFFFEYFFMLGTERWPRTHQNFFFFDASNKIHFICISIWQNVFLAIFRKWKTHKTERVFDKLSFFILYTFPIERNCKKLFRNVSPTPTPGRNKKEENGN